MRVLLVSEARGVGGAEVYLERLARGLGADVATVAVADRPELHAWRVRMERAGIPLHAYPDSPLGWRRLARWARGRFDLVHLNLPSTYDGGQGLLAWVLHRLGGVPVVTTEHLTRIPRSRRRRWMKLATASAVQTVITVSEASRRALVEEGLAAEQVLAIPNGVPDPGAPAPMPARNGPLRVAVLASLEPRKQIDLLIRAVAASSRSLTVAVAGTGPEKERLLALARDLGVDDRVRFPGSVADPYAFLTVHHVLALPSRLEAMPLSVLEAMACGRGVLASALPGLEEVVVDGETGCLLPPGDPAAWARALDQLDPSRVTAWGAAARERYCRHFREDRWLEATRAVYVRALERTR